MPTRSAPRPRAVRLIRIHCPIALDTFRALAAGQLEAIEDDPIAFGVLGVIRADNGLGDFGLYRGVFELSLGVEGFTPTPEASPKLGLANSDILSPTAIITTYVDAELDDEVFSALLCELAAKHPWEIPVIEVSTAQLFA